MADDSKLKDWRGSGRPVVGQPSGGSTTSPKLTAPLIMFNALVESFSSSVGYGAESSTMQMTLVEDPDNGHTIKHSLDGGVTSVDGFPDVGTCCQFVFEGFEFVGIFQRYNYTQGTDGRRYDVTFESPSKVLDGVQVILNGFEGTTFSGNYPIYPAVDEQNFTSQINNVYNPFGVKENYSWGGNFGYSDYNAGGFPVKDDDGQTGIAAKGLLTLIEEISQSKFTYDNPDGPAADTSFNSDDKELIGGPIYFGHTKYTIDFGELKTLVPDFFRMKGDVVNINAIVNECCEIILHDYVTIIDPVLTSVPVGNSGGKTVYEDQVRNGVVPIQYEDDDPDENVIGPVITFKYLDKSEQPQPGVVADLVENAKLGNTLISADNGQEYADVVTQKLMIGGPASRVWEADISYLIPVYGKDRNGNWLLGSGFEGHDSVPVEMPGGNVEQLTVNEMKYALAGFQAWCLWREMCINYPTLAFSGADAGGLSSISMVLTDMQIRNMHAWVPGTWASGLNGIRMRTWRLFREARGAAMAEEDRRRQGGGQPEDGAPQGGGGGQTAEEIVKPIYERILDTAQNYYGKTYMVMLPVEPGGLKNNLRYKNEFETEAAWEIADSGWDPDFRVKDIKGYDDEGKLKAVAAYHPGNAFQGHDPSEIETILPYSHPDWVMLMGAEIEVDDQIYWIENPYADDNDNPFDDVTAMCHITCPQVQRIEPLKYFNNALSEIAHDILAMPSEMGTAKRGQLGVLRDGNKESLNQAEDALTYLRGFPGVARPLKVTIPQESIRYSWGPWYKYGNSKVGKAEVEKDDDLRPETFGSVALMDKGAFALAHAGTADLYASEAGSVDLAEFPQYNIADRFNTNGPYITKMDMQVGTGGFTTQYQFSTWTRNFGKIAKYNIDRIAKIWKNKIKRLKASREGVTPGTRAGINAPMRQQDQDIVNKPNNVDFFSGVIFPLEPANSAAPLNIPTQFLSSTKNMGTLQSDLSRQDAQGHDVYDYMFGCSQEQLISPVGIKKTPPDIADEEVLPYIRKAEKGENIKGTADTDGTFDESHTSPTALNLNPYYFPSQVDFAAVVTNDYQWFESNHLHLQHHDYKVGEYAEEVRTFGLRGPILLSGWGYDVVGYPAPGDDTGHFVPANPAQHRGTWKTGPVDLMWDDERQVWAGGLQFLEGKLTASVEPATWEPGQECIPDESGKVEVRRRTATQLDGDGNPIAWEWKSTGESITITNRDPSLKVDLAEAADADPPYDVYVMVTRINYEWRIVYISCDNFNGG